MPMNTSAQYENKASFKYPNPVPQNTHHTSLLTGNSS